MVRQELINRLRSINGDIAEVIFERNNREYSVLIYLVNNPLGLDLIKHDLHWRIFESISEFEGSPFFLDRSFYIVSANRFVSDYCYEPITLMKMEREYNEYKKPYETNINKAADTVIDTSDDPDEIIKDRKYVSNFFNNMYIISIIVTVILIISLIGTLTSTSTIVSFPFVLGAVIASALCACVARIYKILSVRFITATGDLNKIRSMIEKQLKSSK